jgi:hypothetical protein
MKSMIELEEMNEKLPKTDCKVPNTPTTFKVSASKSSECSERNERNATNMHLHTEYSSGAAHKHAHIESMGKDEDYCEAGAKIDIILSNCVSPMKPPRFKSVALEEVSERIHGNNDGLSSSQRQDETFRKIFKQK